MAFQSASKDIVRSVSSNITGVFADEFVVIRGQTPGDIDVAAGTIAQALLADETNSARWFTIQVTPTRTRSFRASAAIRVVSTGALLGDVAWGFTWPEDLFASSIVSITWLIKPTTTTWEVRSRWSGVGSDKSITWNNNSWMRVGFEVLGTTANFYYNSTEFATQPTSAEDTNFILLDSRDLSAGTKAEGFDTRALFMAVQFSGNGGAGQNHACDNVLLEEWDEATPAAGSGPVGGFFSPVNSGYSAYKSSMYVHDLLTRVQIL